MLIFSLLFVGSLVGFLEFFFFSFKANKPTNRASSESCVHFIKLCVRRAVVIVVVLFIQSFFSRIFVVIHSLAVCAAFS